MGKYHFLCSALFYGVKIFFNIKRNISFRLRNNEDKESNRIFVNKKNKINIFIKSKKIINVILGVLIWMNILKKTYIKEEKYDKNS